MHPIYWSACAYSPSFCRPSFSSIFHAYILDSLVDFFLSRDRLVRRMYFFHGGLWCNGEIIIPIVCMSDAIKEEWRFDEWYLCVIKLARK